MSEIYNISAQDVANAVARTRSEEGAARLLGISEAEVKRYEGHQLFWDVLPYALRYWKRSRQLLDLAANKQRKAL